MIHTCVTGGYDVPRTQPDLGDVSWIFHTDDPALVAPPPWKTFVLHPEIVPPELHPRTRAKFPKITPWRFRELAEFDYALWIDGNLRIEEPRLLDIVQGATVNGCCFSPHFSRDCIYDEVWASIGMGKYQGEPVAPQAIHYQQRGMPADWGLIETSVIGRWLDHPVMREIGERWLAENLAWSYQDQVSLPFVLWSMGVETGRMPKPWRSAGWASYAGHLDR